MRSRGFCLKSAAGMSSIEARSASMKPLLFINPIIQGLLGPVKLCAGPSERFQIGRVDKVHRRYYYTLVESGGVYQ